MSIEEDQKKICQKNHTEYWAVDPQLKVGISKNVKSGIMPLNGLRHPPRGDTSGWYIWAGKELSKEPDFFEPLHISHLKDWCPAVLKFLGLPPGWRFLTDGTYEDVWEDPSLLKLEPDPHRRAE